MMTDVDVIRRECRELGSALQTVEEAAVRARLAKSAPEKKVAVAELERHSVAIREALGRIGALAMGSERVPRIGIPDPVQDLDQEPQD